VKYTIGVDEVGYGSWAGPVVVCALKSYEKLPNIFLDSKIISPKKREDLFLEVISLYKKKAVDVFISFGSVKNIVDHGLLKTTLASMSFSINHLYCDSSRVLIDGKHAPSSSIFSAETVIKGDQRVLEISAASIVAKVYRDSFMQALSLIHPQYSWYKNKGYGTQAHRDAISLFGVSRYHRTNYKPLRSFVV